MALNDATARIEASIATLGDNITSQQSAIASEIRDLATALSNQGGDTSDIENRLNASADKLDALSQQVAESTSQLQADDQPSGGDTGTDQPQV